MLKHFPLFLDMQRSGEWKRRFEASAEYAAITGERATHYPPVMLEELTGKTVMLVGYGSIGKEIERMLQPFDVELIRACADGAGRSQGACSGGTGCSCCRRPRSSC